MFVSLLPLQRYIKCISIGDSTVNNSDHRSVLLDLDSSFCLSPTSRNRAPVSGNKAYNIRWDKGDISANYGLLGCAISDIQLDWSCINCDFGCNCERYRHFINVYYSLIVLALKHAEKQFIPSILHSSIHHFWNEELDVLKSKSISWHAIWNDPGRLSSGLIHQIKVSSKLKYKLAIKSAYLSLKTSMMMNCI